MTGFRKQLAQALQKNYWEISEQITGNEWWEIEHWLIQSNRKPVQIWLSFISHNGEDFQASVDEVRATNRKVETRLKLELSISSLDMREGKFSDELDAFIQELNQFRQNLI